MGFFSLNSQWPMLLYVLLLSVLMNNASGISPDGEVLISFRAAIVRSDGVLLQWRPEDSDPCGWRGVKCDPKTKRVISLSLPNHKLSGPISPDIGKLDHLQFLFLHDNFLYGTIPPELGNCTELRALYVQGNYLSGLIPSELGNLSVLENLDISSNTLSGLIPQSLGKLGKLLTLNVSSNFLGGSIPSDGVLNNFNESSFVGNHDLCGKQVNKRCNDAGGPATDSQSPTSAQNQDGKKKYSARLLTSTSATVGALLLVALMCFWGCFLYKKLGKNDGKGLAMDVSGGASIVMFHGDLPYSSKDIIKKLETLNEEHIIGSGGFGTVYRLAMDDGNVFALKRIVKMNEVFDRFFERELEILGSIKHRYLVNLRGYCNSSTSKLLIYDFLPGGSLDEALHERSEQLDWDTRLNIIMGAAKGLARGELCATMATLSLCSFLTVGRSHCQPTPTLCCCCSSSKTNFRFLSLAPSLFSSRAPTLSFVTKFSETEPSILESQPQPETEPSQVIEATPDSEPEREEVFAETEASIPEVELSQVTEPTPDLQPKREEVFAVVMIGSRQYIVFPGRFIYTQRLKDAKVNDKVTLNKVLLVGTKTHTYIGQPVVPNAAVQAVVEEQGKNKKVTVFKYKKKKGYRRNIGHRQPNTRIKITGITGYENAPAAANL